MRVMKIFIFETLLTVVVLIFHTPILSGKMKEQNITCHSIKHFVSLGGMANNINI